MGVLKLCAEEIEKQGLEAEILTLNGKNINSCIACSKCGVTGKCVFNDGINEIDHRCLRMYVPTGAMMR